MLVGMTLFELVVYLRGSFLPAMYETMGLMSSKDLIREGMKMTLFAWFCCEHGLIVCLSFSPL